MSIESPTRRDEIVVSCEGSRRVGTIINRRYWRWRCTQKRCRHPESTTERPIRTYHIADFATGRLVATEFEDSAGRVIRPGQEEQHHGR